MISPEGVIEENGQLRLVDPAGEGLRLLARMNNEHQPPTWNPFTAQYYEAVAMPDEIGFVRRDLLRPQEEFAPTRDGYVLWSEARRHYDALFVLDPTQVWGTGVSVLVRRESLMEWTLYLRDLPAPSYKEKLPYMSIYLRDRLPDVSLAPSVDEGGDYLVDGWSCATLYEAIHMMLYLDLRSRAELRQCGLRDCPQYFRPGAHDSKYCCDEHTSVATTRRSRGQLP